MNESVVRFFSRKCIFVLLMMSMFFSFLLIPNISTVYGANGSDDGGANGSDDGGANGSDDGGANGSGNSSFSIAKLMLKCFDLARIELLTKLSIIIVISMGLNLDMKLSLLLLLDSIFIGLKRGKKKIGLEHSVFPSGHPSKY